MNSLQKAAEALPIHRKIRQFEDRVERIERDFHTPSFRLISIDHLGNESVEPVEITPQTVLDLYQAQIQLNKVRLASLGFEYDPEARL